jgi:hypothetical protein
MVKLMELYHGSLKGFFLIENVPTTDRLKLSVVTMYRPNYHGFQLLGDFLNLNCSLIFIYLLYDNMKSIKQKTTTQ